MIKSVSVVVPIYNGASFICQTIDAILGQTFRNIDVVLVDDNSKDNSAEIIKEYVQKDSRVRAVCLSKNSGIPMATSRIGCEHAKNEWIIGIGHDDIIESDYVQKLVDRQDETDADVILSRMVPFSQNGSEMSSIPNESFDFSKVISGEEAFFMTIGGWQLSLNGKLVRREVYGKMPDFIKTKKLYMNSDEFVGQYILHRSEKVAFADANYNYRVLESSITHKLSVKLYERLFVDGFLDQYVTHEYSANSDEARRMRRIRFDSLSYWMQEYVLTKKMYGRNQRCKILKMLFTNYYSQHKLRLFGDYKEHSTLWKLSRFTFFGLFYLTFNPRASLCLKKIGMVKMK